MNVFKGLPRALKDVAREASEQGFSGASSIYAYNKVNAHWAGRKGEGARFVGANAINRSLLRPVKRKTSVSDVHRANSDAYRKARVERELRRMLERGQ
jgi:hypothetical protein